MQIRVDEISFASSNGRSLVKGWVYAPMEGDCKGIVQISHGMCEYIGRYDPFLRFLAQHGYVACGNDHIGHGHSSPDEDHLGYMGGMEGDRWIVEDLHRFNRIVRKTHPGLPCVMLGHSMGSFAARVYAAQYGHTLAGLILSGTGGKNPAAPLGEKLARALSRRAGERERTPVLTRLIFQDYNRAFEPRRTDSDWLTRDNDLVDRYIDDPFCTFTFTNSAYAALLRLHHQANSRKTFQRTPKELPVYLFSGDKDPVGGNGEGVAQVFRRYNEAGLWDVELKLYPDGRHEMLNELNRQEVYKDVLGWLDFHLAE
ncbi:alpha/beta fold hydrolase [Merdimmobilis hominis]|jgi:alpha-beta hydrolase superfamily lysophospholipase|uniref:alpha/beta fold hydrolase n=1 Tax=Merdimmobilis hominis TaxID=2897707 RepID=UPI0018997898|nr:alpha/beta fold hydrolase [Merdimmobilis hominis]